MTDTEVAIIGGGIAGASTAFHLSQHGMAVTLLERGEVASEASGQNMGGLGGTGWGNVPNLNSYLTMGSLEIFKRLQLDMGYDLEFRLSGSLTGIHTQQQYEFIRDRVLWLRSNGFQGELLTPREALAIEPEANPDLLGYMLSPMRGQADPVKSTRAFADAAEKSGAQVNTGQNVTSISASTAGGYILETESERWACETLVIAAGAWCGPLGKLLGLRIPIVPVRGQMWATESLPPRVFHDISSAESSFAWSQTDTSDDTDPPELTHKAGHRVTRHLYGRQRKNGEIIFGGDRQSLGYDTTPDSVGIEVNRGHASEVLPMLADLPVARTWAGSMPFSLDGDPIIGRIALRENLYIVSGLGSSGFGRGPMAGKLAADFIRTGHMPHVLAESDPARCVTEVG